MRSSYSFSKYTDNEIKVFDDIIQQLDSKCKSETRNEPHFVEETLINTFEAVTEIKNYSMNESNYRYKVYHLYREDINTGFEDDRNREVRISITDLHIFVLTNESITQYIINKSSKDTAGKTLIRNLLGYEGRNEIELNNINLLLVKDFYLWLFHVVLNGRDSEEEIIIESIEGYRGGNSNSLAHVTGIGSEVLNLLSTLTFIFESERINRVKVMIKYNTHKFSVDLYQNGNLKISFSEYEGDYDELAKYESMAKIIFDVMLVVLPKLSAIYTKDEWDLHQFKMDIGKEVVDKIEQKIH
ncbi:hypothetical protein [Salinicoccus halodurans]|uniref:Uncharacterized protein n=1 Tax=Salinicoccus halodurans TaxID=407035 RepID=A0A0F7D4G3_9STAP|nr:hypothetical protein [Salinicoccus halodurans]AKG74185.1 hypothetical protein AAT16_08030 [Salinicoccus halodurans]SFK61719.1 hypothetical protein SAMN05216235_0854 [Salinicoccus halodurans]